MDIIIAKLANQDVTSFIYSEVCDNSNMIRTSCTMKPIEVKQKAVSRFLLTRLGGTGLTLPQDVENYIRIFVRLVDKAIQEYNQIYELVMEEINEAKRPIKELEKGRILYADLIINELENCINTTNRAMSLFEKLAQNKNTPFSMERLLKRFAMSVRGRLTPIRNVVEHIDNAIASGEIKAGNPVIVDLTEDASMIKIDKFELTTSELANLLQKLHELALEVAIFNANTTYKKNLRTIVDKTNNPLND